MPGGDEADPPQWYALRDLKRPNALTPAWMMLADMGVEAFTPLREVVTVTAGRRVRRRRSVIPDLLFARATRATLDPIIGRTPTLQYRYLKGAPYMQPLTVATADMDRFILACSHDPGARIYTPDEVTAAMVGSKVTIVGGPLDSLSGNLLRIRGSRKKRLLVQLPGIAAVAVEVSPEYIRLC